MARNLITSRLYRLGLGPAVSHTAGRAQVLRRLDNVDDKVKAFFAPAAKAVLDNSDAHNALAAALAALSGIIEVPKQRRCAPGARGQWESMQLFICQNVMECQEQVSLA